MRGRGSLSLAAWANALAASARAGGAVGTVAQRVVSLPGGSAVYLAFAGKNAKGKLIAAHMLEAASGDIAFADGWFAVAGTDRKVHMTEVARAAYIPHDFPLETLEPVCSADDVVAAIDAARAVFVEEGVHRYVVALLRHTRNDPHLALGASPRAGIAVLRVAKARALLEGRDYVVPDDVKAVVQPVLAHRLLLAPQSRAAGHTTAAAVAEAIQRTPVPV